MNIKVTAFTVSKNFYYTGSAKTAYRIGIMEQKYEALNTSVESMGVSRGGGGGQGVPTHPVKSQKYRVSQEYWSGSPEKPQSYQASIQFWAIIGTPAKHHLNGVSGPMMAPLKWYLLGSSLPSKKNLVKVGPLTKLSGSAHGIP